MEGNPEVRPDTLEGCVMLPLSHCPVVYFATSYWDSGLIHLDWRILPCSV